MSLNLLTLKRILLGRSAVIQAFRVFITHEMLDLIGLIKQHEWPDRHAFVYHTDVAGLLLPAPYFSLA